MTDNGSDLRSIDTDDRSAELVAMLVDDPTQRATLVNLMRGGGDVTGDDLAAALVLATRHGIADDVTGYHGSDSPAAMTARRAALWETAAALTVARHAAHATGHTWAWQRTPVVAATATRDAVDALAALAGQNAELSERLAATAETAETVETAVADRDMWRSRALAAEGRVNRVERETISPRWAGEALAALRDVSPDPQWNPSSREAAVLLDRYIRIVTELEADS